MHWLTHAGSQRHVIPIVLAAGIIDGISVSRKVLCYLVVSLDSDVTVDGEAGGTEIESSQGQGVALYAPVLVQP